MSIVIEGAVTVKVFGLIKTKPVQGSWGVLYDADSNQVHPRVELFDQKKKGSPVHTITLTHLKFPDKSYRQAGDHFVLSVKKEKHHFQLNNLEDKEDWVQSLCHVSQELWKQRASTLESSDLDENEDSQDMSENFLYDSYDKVQQFKISINPTKTSEANGLRDHYLLNPTMDSLRLLDIGGSKTIHEWPYRLIRKYGCSRNVFRMEVGRRCSTGEGEFLFFTPEGDKLTELIAMYTQSQISHQQISASMSSQGNENPVQSGSWKTSRSLSEEAPAMPVRSQSDKVPKDSRSSELEVAQGASASLSPPRPAPRNSISARKENGSSSEIKTTTHSDDTKIYQTSTGLTAPLDFDLKHELHNKLHSQASIPHDSVSGHQKKSEDDHTPDTAETNTRQSERQRKKLEKKKKAAEAKLKKELEKEQKKKAKEQQELQETQNMLKNKSKNHGKTKGKISVDLQVPKPEPDQSNIYDEPGDFLPVCKQALPPPESTGYCEAEEVASNFHKPRPINQSAQVAEEYSIPEKPKQDSWRILGRPDSDFVHDEDYDGILRASLSQAKSKVAPIPSHQQISRTRDDEDDTYSRLGAFTKKPVSENVYGLASGKKTVRGSKVGAFSSLSESNDYNDADSITAQHGATAAAALDLENDYTLVS